MSEIRYCGRCGAKFSTYFGGKIYCSRRCRVLYYRQMHAGKRLEGVIDKILEIRNEKGEKVMHLSRTDLFGYRYKTLKNMYENMKKHYGGKEQ